MKERPIIFSAPMVRAIIEGRKTQTRRLIKLPDNVVEGPRYWSTPSGRPQPGYADPGVNYWTPSGNHIDRCPYGFPGDRLWVKENWAQRLDRDHLNGTELYEAGVRDAWYWADGPGKCCRTGCAGAAGRVRTARLMPRWASRITLEVTAIRVQRLQEIGDDDAIAEGVDAVSLADMPRQATWSHRQDFVQIWDRINAKRAPWDTNPWVWVVEFRKLPTEYGGRNE